MSASGSSAAVTPRSTSTAISAADLRVRLTALAHDSMMGRMTGEAGSHVATAYIASEFERLGLEPAGENGTYFQTVPFFRLSADSARINVDEMALRPGDDFLPISLRAALRPMDGATVVFGGYAGDTLSWPTAAELAGRVVVLTLSPDASGVRTRVRVAAIASHPRLARAAAVAIAQLDLIGAEQVSSIRAGTLVNDTTRTTSAPPLFFVTPAAADRLLGAPSSALRTGATGRAVTGSLAASVSALPYPARNVVAILRGRDPLVNGQYVSLSAHSDHVGFDRSPVDHDSLRAFNRVVRPMGADSPPRAATAEESLRVRSILDSLRRVRPPRLDSIRNGADDDGSGTVSLLEIAEAMAARAERPRRSILFVSHTAEEVGLTGSRWFTDHPTVPRDSIIAEIDQDMIGRGSLSDAPGGGPAYLEVVGARRLSTQFGDLLEAASARQASPFRFDYSFDAPGHPQQYYCRADHFSYARYGIPSVSLSRGLHLDYHQVTDEAEYIDYDVLARVSQLVMDAMLSVAELDRRVALDKPRGNPLEPCRQ